MPICVTFASATPAVKTGKIRDASSPSGLAGLVRPSQSGQRVVIWPHSNIRRCYLECKGSAKVAGPSIRQDVAMIIAYWRTVSYFSQTQDYAGLQVPTIPSQACMLHARCSHDQRSVCRIQNDGNAGKASCRGLFVAVHRFSADFLLRQQHHQPQLVLAAASCERRHGSV